MLGGGYKVTSKSELGHALSLPLTQCLLSLLFVPQSIAFWGFKNGQFLWLTRRQAQS